MANAKCLRVRRAQGEIILVTDASNVGEGGTLLQWQALEKEELDSAISQWGTDEEVGGRATSKLPLACTTPIP